jgi:glycosyltransferase involved in cell wall biosynthesis
MFTSSEKPKVTILGQTPPPWHGQAVATKILFDHDWTESDVECIRMEYSEDMDEVGRFSFKKISTLVRLIFATRKSLSRSQDNILLYPPASAKWIPFLRDVIFLASVRGKANKVVFIFHASGLAAFTESNFFTRFLAKIAYDNADMALEVAEEAISPHAVFGAKNYLWCPCGIEVPDLPRLRHEDSPLTALFVGSLQEGKGILEILKTAAVLKKKGLGNQIQFHIVGRWMDSDFENETLELHESLGLEEIVHFRGQLTGDEKWKAYQESDVFFFPSHYPSEASPIVLMEALGMGLPVISTLWNGIPALMRGCERSTLLPIKSPEAYAQALLDLYAERSSLESFSQESRKFYEDHFLPERFIERVNRSFQAVAQVKLINSRQEQRPAGSSKAFSISVYLADQNPGHDRSLGISRMTEVILNNMSQRGDLTLEVIASHTSQKGPREATKERVIPWGTRSKLMRIITDHLHPLLSWSSSPPDIWYFPKGYLPRFRLLNAPTVVTIHDTIIHHYWENHPGWRKSSEYFYWAQMLKSTIRHADGIFTVSQTAKQQILDFIKLHKLPEKEIIVTYEPCYYEDIEQPEYAEKGETVVHLASREPHKRTHDLICWWAEKSKIDSELPILELIGNIPSKSKAVISDHDCFKLHAFLPDETLRTLIGKARALILPSEIEGFGLPALEAYYLGTPVCFVRGTSVEEILQESIHIGGFQLDAPESLWTALDQVLSMSPDEIRRVGLELRERFASRKVVDRMLEGFKEIVKQSL